MSMTEIVFRRDGEIKTAVSAGNVRWEHVNTIAWNGLFGGEVFGDFGKVGDVLAVEESRGGVIGRSQGGKLVKLCTGGFTPADDPTIRERVTAYQVASAEALVELMEAADKKDLGEALHRMVIEDLGLPWEQKAPMEERTLYRVTMLGDVVILQEERIVTAEEGADE